VFYRLAHIIRRPFKLHGQFGNIGNTGFLKIVSIGCTKLILNARDTITQQKLKITELVRSRAVLRFFESRLQNKLLNRKTLYCSVISGIIL